MKDNRGRILRSCGLAIEAGTFRGYGARPSKKYAAGIVGSERSFWARIPVPASRPGIAGLPRRGFPIPAQGDFRSRLLLASPLAVRVGAITEITPRLLDSEA